jgi:hypothetical protein
MVGGGMSTSNVPSCGDVEPHRYPPHCFHVARQRARNARWSYRVRISAIVIFLPPRGTARIGVRPMGAFRHPYQRPQGPRPRTP